MSPDHFLEATDQNILLLDAEHYYALENMKSCRTIEKGGRILRCSDCGNEVVIYNPCNQRGCPKCSKKNQILWAEKLKAKLLPTGHTHMIFTIPSELTEIWKADKTLFINSFFHSIQQAFKKTQNDMGIKLGIVMVFQSHGKGLCFKPHMHCIVTDHGLDETNKWVSYPTISYTKLSEHVREILISHIKKKLHPWLRNYFKELFESCDENKWSVYPAVHKFNGDNIVNYLSKSVSGMVIDIENDLDYNKEEQFYTIREYHLGEIRSTTLDLNTFWNRYMSHIPPKGVVTIRNYGLYSNKYREKLERIRIEEFKMVSLNEELADYEEECSTCHGTMETKEEFTSSELPLLMRLHIQKNHSPPEHGFSFQTNKLVTS